MSQENKIQNLYFKEVTSKLEKIDRLNEFSNEYNNGQLYTLHPYDLEPDYARTFDLMADEKRIGTIRSLRWINGLYSKKLNLWSAADSFVKPAYRGQGFQKMMIEYLIQNKLCHVTFLENRRFKNNKK